MRRIAALAPALVACTVALALSTSTQVRFAHALPDGSRVTLAPGASYWFFSERANADDAFGYGGAFGFMVDKHWGFEGLLGYSSTSTSFDGPVDGVIGGQDADLRYLGLDLKYHLLPGRRIHPYLSLGYASLHYDPQGNGNQETFGGFEGGGGILMRLDEGTNHRVSLRLDARDVLLDLGQPILSESQWGNNFMVSAMLQVEYGENWHKDTDGDGIIDRSDECPDTELGVVVDAVGCPVDSDGDGVFDGPDACAGTPAGAVVDSTGCPIDSDGDGVFDGIDTCADTPQGAVVDATGCPIDSDGDKVPDGIDQCPDTPSAVRVDAQGCPTVDSDDERTLYEEGRLSLAIEFASGKADLAPGTSAQLRVIADAMRKWPDLRIEIGGHTDDRGSEANNQRLSLERAEAVKAYLVDTFTWVTDERLTAVGYGEEKPVADNATEEGRAQNRRVEFVVLSGGPKK